MTILPIAFAALTVAFPREGADLGSVRKCYVIGAVDGGETNVTVNGKAAYVYRTGAWAAMVDVAEGTNEIRAVAGTNTAIRTFLAITPPERKGPPPEYPKLPYALDDAQEPPTNRAPGEITVYVDAGHGGHDTGAISPHGWFEKDANLLVAKATATALSALGYNAVLTRESDFFIPLEDRPKAAHEGRAAAFVSIHHNAPGHSQDAVKSRYISVYAWNAIGEALAADVSARLEKAADGEPPGKGVLHANFKVTRSPQVPSCLVEVDFVTSPAGEEAIWDPLRIARTGKAIAAGIDDWCRGRNLEKVK